jgi:hypothetical protein
MAWTVMIMRIKLDVSMKVIVRIGGVGIGKFKIFMIDK